MQAAVEISMYPLEADYEPLILDFIRRLREQPGITVQTNSLSTQLYGPYDLLAAVVMREMKTTFKGPHKVVMVMKWINAELEPKIFP